MSAPRLRPLGIGEILDVAIKIYWRNARTLLPLVAVVTFPAQILLNLILVSAGGEDFLDTNAAGEPQIDTDELATLFAGFGAAITISFVATTIATGAAYKAVAEAYLGGSPDWRASLTFVLRRLHSLLWLTVLTAVVVVIGFLLCVVPGIYLVVAFTVAVPVLLTEGLRGRRALGRSRRLVRGRWWGTLAIVVLGALLVGIVSAVIQGLVTAISFTDVGTATLGAFIVGTLSGTISSTLTTPFQAAYTTVLYVDLRVRKEAFDLQLLAQSIGVEPTGLPAAAPIEELDIGDEEPPYWPPPPGWRPGGGGGE